MMRAICIGECMVELRHAHGGEAVLAGADLVYLSGISLAILTPTDRCKALDLLARLLGRVGWIAFDPNYLAVRLRGASGEEAALAGLALASRVVSAPGAILPKPPSLQSVQC